MVKNNLFLWVKYSIFSFLVLTMSRLLATHCKLLLLSSSLILPSISSNVLPAKYSAVSSVHITVSKLQNSFACLFINLHLACRTQVAQPSLLNSVQNGTVHPTEPSSCCLANWQWKQVQPVNRTSSTTCTDRKEQVSWWVAVRLLVSSAFSAASRAYFFNFFIVIFEVKAVSQLLDEPNSCLCHLCHHQCLKLGAKQVCKGIFWCC